MAWALWWRAVPLPAGRQLASWTRSLCQLDCSWTVAFQLSEQDRAVIWTELI